MIFLFAKTRAIFAATLAIITVDYTPFHYEVQRINCLYISQRIARWSGALDDQTEKPSELGTNALC